MNKLFWAAIVIATTALTGCAAPTGHHAPIIDRSVSATENPALNRSVSGNRNDADKTPAQPERDWRPQVYAVQKGDTLYSIAFNFGFDYHDLAELNGIQNPAVIQVGQEIRLFPAAGTANYATEIKPVEVVIKSQPVVVKLPYSEQAVAQVEKLQTELPKAEAKPVTEVKQPKPEVIVAAGGAEAAVQWEMPASGKVVASFSENDNRKGVDIAGKLGQPVSASAAGKVVYSGSGLRGYGKLVIIKHNSTYLSAYAHNDKLLVKEGQMVAKGQMIAEMGSTDANRVALHFEIRKLGKPVDPAKYLAFHKS